MGAGVAVGDGVAVGSGVAVGCGVAVASGSRKVTPSSTSVYQLSAMVSAAK